MIHPDAEPVSHVSPYKRIELGAKPKKPEPKWVPVPDLAKFKEILSQEELIGELNVYVWPINEEAYCG